MRPRLLVAALAGAGVLVLVIALQRGTTESTKPASPTATQTTTAAAVPAAPAPPIPSGTPQARASSVPTQPPTIDDVLAASAPTATLVAGIDAGDAVIVAESVNALVARGTVSALDALVTQNVAARPKAAPSIIYGLGRLAALAAPDAQKTAVDRLLALMAEEKSRGAQESRGNLLQIYEALGDAGDPRAIGPLERELLDPTVPNAPKVVIVHALVALHAQQSRGTLEQLAAQLAKSTETGFEGELVRELLGVIKQALVDLS